MLAGTVASYLTLKDTFTKPKSKQNNSGSTFNSQALKRSYGKNLNVFTTWRQRQQLQRPRAWFTSHSQSRRMLLGHLANNWPRYWIGCQPGFIKCVLRRSILARIFCFTLCLAAHSPAPSQKQAWRNNKEGNCNICSDEESWFNIYWVTTWRVKRLTVTFCNIWL